MCSPAARLRTDRVTSASAAARARAVSTPMPDAPPVTMARLPPRSMPDMTSVAVDCAPNGVVMRWLPMGFLSVVDARSPELEFHRCEVREVWAQDRRARIPQPCQPFGSLRNGAGLIQIGTAAEPGPL